MPTGSGWSGEPGTVGQTGSVSSSGERPVLVVDYGAQYAQLIARRVREAQVYSEVVPHTASVDDILARDPAAVVLSGGPASVYADGAPSIDPALFETGVPVFGICYGFQLMASALGGTVAHTGAREYGRTELDVADDAGRLHDALPSAHPVWMSHGDGVTEAPAGFTVTASSAGAPVAAFEDVDRRLAGVQYHPEVGHSPHGQQVLERFLRDVAGVDADWTTATIVAETVDAIRAQVGPAGRAICGLSGGVDSAVAAALVRKIIGREFIRAFEGAARSVAEGKGVDFLVQGTLYPDVVESGGGTGAATIKSHHNVGGLPDDLQFTLVEPLRALFKDEVRAVGAELGLPEGIVGRQPFPGPGLAIRIIGAVDAERLDLLRRADVIAREELTSAGLDRTIWQCPVVLLADVRSVGVQGDGRTYGHPVVLRPVSSEDAMTADWTRLPYDVLERISTRITNECAEVNRVVLDVTSKPPGTIEWE